jgi:hypothetical protein
MHPMVLLGDDAEVELLGDNSQVLAHFGLLGDSANLDT